MCVGNFFNLIFPFIFSLEKKNKKTSNLLEAIKYELEISKSN